MRRKLLLLCLCLPALPGGWIRDGVLADQPPAWLILSDASVTSHGVFLDQIVAPEAKASPPHVLVASAPPLGKIVTLTRAQIQQQLAATGSKATNILGAERIRISRKTRTLDEEELKQWLTATLQSESVRDRGELELRFSRPWNTAVVPDEDVTLRVSELPTAGVTPNFIVRFEIRTAQETVGSWQLPVQARIWREVFVAKSASPRGLLLKDADLMKERRDVLASREALAALPSDDLVYELAEPLASGAPLTNRSIRARPVVQRGKVVEALIVDGALTISMRVEVLEDGLPGQTVRVRNPKTKREFRGKVKDEETIVVAI